MDKPCCLCRRLLPPSEYYREPKRKDGLSPRCVDCGRVAVNNSYRKLRTAAMVHLGGACRQCGYSIDPRALVFDHVHGGGTKERREGPGRPHVLHAAILADTAGVYQLLCVNCNSIKRIAENERGTRVYKRAVYNGPLVSKFCPRCHTTKPATEFCCNAARYDGLSVYCALCRVESESEKYQEGRLRAITYLGGCCGHCGYDADIRALVIDHVNGGGGAARKSGVAGIMVFRTVLHASNAGKYQLLCASCNIIKRFEEEEDGTRVYERDVPTARIERADRRRSDEIRALRSEQFRRLWEDVGYREAASARASESMKRRWASGEVPSRRKSTT